MSRYTHRICKHCKKTVPRSNLRLRKNGHIKERACKECHVKTLEALKARNIPSKSYHKYRKDYCEMCGFKGLPCQMDVDHIDMNHKNNDPINLRTLCANCHRLVSYYQGQQIVKF